MYFWKKAWLARPPVDDLPSETPYLQQNFRPWIHKVGCMWSVAGNWNLGWSLVLMHMHIYIIIYIYIHISTDNVLVHTWLRMCIVTIICVNTYFVHIYIYIIYTYMNVNTYLFIYLYIIYTCIKTIYSRWIWYGYQQPCWNCPLAISTPSRSKLWGGRQAHGGIQAP